MRALKAVLVLVLGALVASCSAESPSATPTDGGPDSRGPFECCELGAPSCHGPVSGTNPDGTCRRAPQDLVPLGWTTRTDERGCPYYVYGHTNSCLANPRPDTSADQPVGSLCATNDDCGPSGLTLCSRMQDGTAKGFCFREGCDLGLPCDGTRGICVEYPDGSTCKPRCTFGDDAVAPTGCGAGASCWFAARDPTSSEVRGLGLCSVACNSDADCAFALLCERETGRCLPKPVTPTKSVGDACTSPSECFCMTRSAGGGYCTQLCHVGAEGACPSATVCDPFLPTEFTKAPLGLAGICSKTCLTDADCAALNATCVAVGGLSVKVCRPK